MGTRYDSRPAQHAKPCNNYSIGAFYLVHTHLGGRGGGVKPPIHFHCVFHAKMGWVGPDSINIAYVLNGRSHTDMIER